MSHQVILFLLSSLPGAYMILCLQNNWRGAQQHYWFISQ